jgi:thioredoxin-like negative regulator of GroEL
MRSPPALLLVGALVAGCTAASQRTDATPSAQLSFDEGVKTQKMNLPAAERALKASLQRDPGNIVALVQLSAVLLAQKRYNEAATVAERCPGRNLAALEMLGIALDRLNDPKGVELLEEVVAEKRGSLAAHLELGGRYAKTEPVRAVEHLRAYLALRPPNQTMLDDAVRRQLLSALLLARWWPDAETLARELLVSHPNDLARFAPRSAPCSPLAKSGAPRSHSWSR